MILHVILGSLLLLIPAGVLYYFDRALLRTFVVASARMGAQLLVLCLMVWVLVRYDRWWLSLLWLVLLTGWATVMMARRKKLGSRHFLPVAAGVAGATLLVGLYLLLAVLPAQNALDARWFVPVMALLVGHSLTMTIRGQQAYESALRSDEQQYEFLRGNGASHLKAVMPFVRRAFQVLLAPTAANLSEMGLFTMPLLLCGIFVGGVQPINAFVVTLMLVIGCVAASVVALMLSLWFADRQLFDRLGKLQ